MKLNEKNKEIVMIVTILIIQTIVFMVAGIKKSYIHMDEAYSLGLASYDKIDIQQNDDFYNTWHNKEYYEDYLTVNENEKNNYTQVYENQKNDVHPPLYYLILRIAMGLHIGSFSKWPGIIINIIIYLFVTVFMYLILKKLLTGNSKYKEKAAFLALLSAITLSSINNAIYIRMYALSTLNIVIITYLHLKLLDKNINNNKLLFAIGLSALVGSLTHYYYLFYLSMLFIMMVIKFLKEKQYKELSKYIATMVFAGILALIIFPYSIQHMFFGYRGQGVISNILNVSEFIKRIALYLLIIDVYVFNNVLFILLPFILPIIVYKKIKKVPLISTRNKYINYIIYPTIFYFLLVAVSAPWVELRYIMPICNLIFIIVLFTVAILLKNLIKEKILNKVMLIMVILILVMPFISNKIINLVIGTEYRKEQESSYSTKQEIVEKLKNESNIQMNIFSNFTDASIDDILLFVKNFKIEPEVLYSNKSFIMNTIKNDLNDLPSLYLLNSNTNRFLDDILLFANIKESYIARDIGCNKEKIQEIIKDRDLSNGIILFMNDGQESEKLLELVKETTDLKTSTYLQRLNACDVYYIH